MWYIREGDNLKILVYVQPGAKSTAIVGIHDGSLKIRLHVPPVDGRANAALLKFLAKQFLVPVSQVKLIHGEKSRKKQLLILSSQIDPEMFDLIP